MIGFIRKIDDLGRVCIPAEARNALGIKNGDPMEIFIENGTIIFKPYHSAIEVTSLLDRIKERINIDEYGEELTAALEEKLAEFRTMVEGDKE
ncbi:AbrB/MazE/SpoVT family DNA-binding domain-containing protein [Anaerotignum sp.]|uniref:AbrB/MazE/SpoVT family DNA-binding domain-containing protein n=1 Tax=Anaerotignum sp. TaxID=2039241 RepID=UPI0027146F23|nr:AbrB/MazE/SpoVT family DNA-binding domain-containing protein [Anaerotignum sp.]